MNVLPVGSTSTLTMSHQAGMAACMYSEQHNPKYHYDLLYFLFQQSTYHSKDISQNQILPLLHKNLQEILVK